MGSISKQGNALGSEGKITSIYQNAQDEYAVLLDCIQNGSPIRVLLLARVENGKIAEMTYNTLKQSIKLEDVSNNFQ